MESVAWNGKEYLDLIRMDPICPRILSCVIENGVMEPKLLMQENNRSKVLRYLSLFQQKGILDLLDTPAGTVIGLSERCCQPSVRSAMGETPGHRIHRFPEPWLRESALTSVRSLSCALARGRFLMERRRGKGEIQIEDAAENCRIWIPEDGSRYGALKIGYPKKRGEGNQWILFDPVLERSAEEDKEREDWIRKRRTEDSVMIFREKTDGVWETDKK